MFISQLTGGLNKANITISNLKESNRLRIVKDTEEQKRIIVGFEK